MSPFESSRWEEHFATGFKKLSAQEIYLKKPSMSIPNDSNILGTLPICLFCFLPVRLSILGNRTHDLSISRSVQSPGYSPATDSLVVFFFSITQVQWWQADIRHADSESSTVWQRGRAGQPEKLVTHFVSAVAAEPRWWQVTEHMRTTGQSWTMR